LFSPNANGVEIGWIVVAARARRRGIGRALVEHVIGTVERPGQVAVTSFGPDNVGGQPARAFFEKLGFQAAGRAPKGPEGGSREVFRLTIG
jgi:ribosomal protein S18 acetylase RimI-like enzyme